MSLAAPGRAPHLVARRTVLGSVLAVAAAASIVVGAPACASSPGTRGPVIEYGLVTMVGAGASNVEVPRWGSPEELTTVELPLRSARVARVRPASDERGWPLVVVELQGNDAQGLHIFSGNHIGRELAILVEGKLASRAVIAERLPGTLQVGVGLDEHSVRAIQQLLAP